MAFTVKFPDELEALLNIMSAAQETTKVEVLRQALGLYRYIIIEMKPKKNTLWECDENGKKIREVEYYG